MGKTATAESETTDKGGTTVLAKTRHSLQLVAYISAGSLVCVLGARPVSMPPSPTHAGLGGVGAVRQGPRYPVLREGEVLEGYCYLDVLASFLALGWVQMKMLFLGWELLEGNSGRSRGEVSSILPSMKKTPKF